MRNEGIRCALRVRTLPLYTSSLRADSSSMWEASNCVVIATFQGARQILNSHVPSHRMTRASMGVLIHWLHSRFPVNDRSVLSRVAGSETPDARTRASLCRAYASPPAPPMVMPIPMCYAMLDASPVHWMAGALAKRPQEWWWSRTPLSFRRRVMIRGDRRQHTARTVSPRCAP